MGRLDGKVAVITGGASGIGEGTCKLFVEEGARVVIADIQDDLGEGLARDLGEDTVYQHTDVAKEEDVRAAVQRACDTFGRLDCIFNNAGFGGVVGPIEELPVEEFDATMSVLLRGVFLGMKHAAPVMKRQGAGSIVSTASVAGIRGGLSPHIYAVAKAAVVQLTKTVALELGESGVRVNCILPGGIITPLVTPAEIANNPEALKMQRKVFETMQAVPRAGMPADIAHAAMFLASDDSTFINGHALVVDGGLSVGPRWSAQPEFFRTYRPMM